MGTTELLGLLGGLALFLYGMQMMSDGLEEAAGNKMKQILEKLTSNRILGVVVGALITAVIQSSSATTVMVVGFVNTGLMTLQQAVWIIMGANIGTTITGQLIALDAGAMAPLFAFLGVCMVVFMKSPKMHHIGKILAGLGVLFIGMDMMGAAMEPLRDSQTFISLMTTFNNPVVGILAGTVFTAVIQSSSAAVGILQTLAAGGLIPFSSAVYVLFGSNIGTCITAVLASIGTNRSAKRTTVIHLLFNLIGTAVFTCVCVLTPLADLVASVTPGRVDAQIANMHTLFNTCTTLLLLPFGTHLAALANKILPSRPEEKQQATALLSLTDEFRRGGRTALGASMIHMDLLESEIDRMLKTAGDNAARSFHVILKRDEGQLAVLDKYEELVDAMNKEISQYISHILTHDIGENNINAIKEFFLITGNAERIGDHAANIGGYLNTIMRRNIVFSDIARQELTEMSAIVQAAMDKLLNRQGDATKWLSELSAAEQQIDDLTRLYREQHLNRMHRELCSEEACILYSELLTDFERIGDHILNIAQAFAKIQTAN